MPQIVNIVNDIPRIAASPNLVLRPLGQISEVAVHWTGYPPRPDQPHDELARIRDFARYHIRKDWGGGVGGFGLMYHRVIGASGVVYLTQPLEVVTWHAHSPANERSLAILVDAGVLPNGSWQQPTAAQLLSLRWYLDSLARQRALLVTDHEVYGHCELPHNDTTCPGSLLQHVRAYRMGRL